jgi:Fe-S cluster assembly ATP-binding protein
MLEIKNLAVEVDGKEIIHNLSLQFHPGKVYALMGPNGSGKTTLAYALSGHPRYKITRGSIILDGKEITFAKPQERSTLGLFLSFQYPVEISGVSISNFLRTIVNVRREKPYTVLEFHALLKETMKKLKIDPSFGKRHVNKGFSGGEKKRAEILQLMMIQPKYALLDETDSGLDIDAIKIVAEGINEARKNKDLAVIIITHYNRFLDFIKPDEVHVISEGNVIATGKYDLAQTIEKNGFEEVIAHAH